MKRLWHVWLVFGLALAAGIAGMTWVTVTALRSERAEAAARQQVLLEENVRLAVWRMDSKLAPLIAQENTRPYFAYRSFYPAERAYNRMFQELRHGEILMPSPLLTELPPYVVVHFQIGPDGELSSPQVPTSNMRDRAETDFKHLGMHERIEDAATRLAALVPYLNQEALLGRLSKETARPAGTVADGNSDESSPRSGLHKPLWLGPKLLLVRRVVVDGRHYVQGCELDWPQLSALLVGLARDLLPKATVEPAAADASGEGPRMLATLPVRVVPGQLPRPVSAGMSPVTFSLWIAWGCVLVGAVAVGTLMMGTIQLSERRASFVSAVTHELRTPITTLQMYSEMLAAGMVQDQAKRSRYLNTMYAETMRLGHLIENVLVYARLERGRGRRHVEDIPLDELVHRVAGRLRDRAAHLGMTLETRTTMGTERVAVKADVSAVEQILLNLVDNACKYAGPTTDQPIQVEAVIEDGRAGLCVRDQGPGVPEADAGRLFRPFSKSAREAAHTAPGVGLGLALSKRLARDMHGDLVLDRTVSPGARFVLLLPLSPAGSGS